MQVTGLPVKEPNIFSVRRVAAAASILLLALAGCKKPEAAKPPPPTVEVMTTTTQDVPVTQEWIGTLDGATNAVIHAQVSGYLVSQNYKEGSLVKKGDVLFQIDPRVFAATLDQAKAQVAVAKANVEKTELDVKRMTPLVTKNAVSQEEMDNATQANLAAKAQLEAAEATVAQKKLDLDFTTVTSPIDGIAGRAEAQIGNLVGPTTGELTTVSTINPMRVYFSVSEQQYLGFTRHFTNASESGSYNPEVDLQLTLSDGTVYQEPGKWFFTSRQVDMNTGTLQVAGLFPNPDYILRPGQYALGRANTETRRNAILVPQRAVSQLQGVYQVIVVDDNHVAHVRTVQVGQQVGDNWLIEKGLQTNESIIVEGVQKAREGTPVVPQPYQVPEKKA